MRSISCFLKLQFSKTIQEVSMFPVTDLELGKFNFIIFPMKRFFLSFSFLSFLSFISLFLPSFHSFIHSFIHFDFRYRSCIFLGSWHIIMAKRHFCFILIPTSVSAPRYRQPFQCAQCVIFVCKYCCKMGLLFECIYF